MAKKTDLAGEVPEKPLINRKVIVELLQLRAMARGAAETYNTAVTEQAEKFKVKKGALKKFISALEGDKKHELDLEIHDIETLLEIDV